VKRFAGTPRERDALYPHRAGSVKDRRDVIVILVPSLTHIRDRLLVPDPQLVRIGLLTLKP